MDLSIESVVYFVLFILGVGVIFGLLMWLIGYIEREFPSIAPFGKVARIVLVVLIVLVLIGMVLSLMGHPMIRFH